MKHGAYQSTILPLDTLNDQRIKWCFCQKMLAYEACCFIIINEEIMRAILCKELGPAEKLVIEDVASPSVEGKGVKIRVQAAALNFPDTLIIEGKYQFKPDLPFSPGNELAGDVIELGPDATRYQIGQRVMGLTGHGAFAEEVVVSEDQLMPIPDAMDDESAAAFSLVYGTSYHALKQRARLQPDETLLVLGAGGGVGLAAVELGRAMGAKVIAAASSEEKLEAAKLAGADDVINYNKEDLRQALKSRYPQGVDVVYDPVGGDYTETALRSMAWKGRFLVVGFASGEIPKLPANLTLLKGCSVVGVFWGAFAAKEPGASMQNMMELFQLFNQGKVKPHVSEVFAFDDFKRAFDSLTGRHAIGKVVLKVGA